jgi:hypothetical protein
MLLWIRGKMGRTGPGGQLPCQGHDGQNAKMDVITRVDVCHQGSFDNRSLHAIMPR